MWWAHTNPQKKTAFAASVPTSGSPHVRTLALLIGTFQPPDDGALVIAGVFKVGHIEYLGVRFLPLGGYMKNSPMSNFFSSGSKLAYIGGADAVSLCKCRDGSTSQIGVSNLDLLIFRQLSRHPLQCQGTPLPLLLVVPRAVSAGLGKIRTPL